VTDEEFRAIIAAGPAVVMVESRHMIALLDERDGLRAENARLREALKNLLDRDERNTCQHEETHRGGFLWEICDVCGAKWADDMGGKTEWKDPPEWVAARDALEVKP
jgi:hypothetical protein